MELNNDTFWGLGKAVREVMEKKGWAAAKAARYVQKALSDEQCLSLMRGPFGVTALLEAEREILRKSSGERVPPMANAGRNRRAEALASMGGWNVVVWLEGHGRVAVGEITAEIARAHAAYCDRTRAIFAEKSQMWTALARVMKRGATLRDVASKLTSEQVAFIEKEVKVSLTTMEAADAA